MGRTDVRLLRLAMRLGTTRRALRRAQARAGVDGNRMVAGPAPLAGTGVHAALLRAAEAWPEGLAALLAVPAFRSGLWHGDVYGETPLARAVRSGDLGRVEQILAVREGRRSAVLANDVGDTPLHAVSPAEAAAPPPPPPILLRLLRVRGVGAALRHPNEDGCRPGDCWEAGSDERALVDALALGRYERPWAALSLLDAAMSGATFTDSCADPADASPGTDADAEDDPRCSFGAAVDAALLCVPAPLRVEWLLEALHGEGTFAESPQLARLADRDADRLRLVGPFARLSHAHPHAQTEDPVGVLLAGLAPFDEALHAAHLAPAIAACVGGDPPPPSPGHPAAMALHAAVRIARWAGAAHAAPVLDHALFAGGGGLSPSRHHPHAKFDPFGPAPPTLPDCLSLLDERHRGTP